MSRTYIEGYSNWGFSLQDNGELVTSFSIYPTSSVLFVRARVTILSPEYTLYYNSSNYHYNGDDYFEGPDKNPPFNVTGDGIGFVWSEVEGPWIDFTISK